MINTDEDALICDLAETYGIYNYRELPVTMIGTLAVGLSDKSRIKRAMSKMPVDMDTLLLAVIADKLSFIAWTKTRDAEKGKNKPPSIASKLLGEKEIKTDVMAFDSPEEFERARQRILNGE